MSKRTSVGLGCGLAFYVAVGVSETFAANMPSDLDIDLAGGSKIEPGNNPRDDLVRNNYPNNRSGPRSGTRDDNV